LWWIFKPPIFVPSNKPSHSHHLLTERVAKESCPNPLGKKHIFKYEPYYSAHLHRCSPAIALAFPKPAPKTSTI